MSGLDDKPFDPFKASRGTKQAGSGGDPGAGAEVTLYDVVLPSGASIGVLTEDEASHLRLMVEQYKAQYALDNVSDLGEVDRCLTLELLSHRNQTWLARRSDYNGGAIDENALTQRCKENSGEIRQIKKTLGVDKVSRDRQTGRGSTHQFISDLLERARRFGLMRNAQHAKAIELANELISMMTARGNCEDEQELRLLRVTDDDIFEWIKDVFTPEFQAIDEAYRAGDQSMWILRSA